MRPRAATLLLIFLPVIALTACTSRGEMRPAGVVLRIDGLLFENRSRSPVSSIRLFVPGTDRFVSCGRIAPGAVCASRFPGVGYNGAPVQVTWVQEGNEWSTGAVSLSADPQVAAAGRAEVRVVVLAPGSAGAVLVGSDSR